MGITVLWLPGLTLFAKRLVRVAGINTRIQAFEVIKKENAMVKKSVSTLVALMLSVAVMSTAVAQDYGLRMGDR